MARRTIFDDVFRTMCQKMPYLLIPLINEVFGTTYSDKEPIVQIRNEHFEKGKEIISDAILRINECTYHIECQSSDNDIMVVRMIEYDFSIALESIQGNKDGTFDMYFPKSCVVYLRKSDALSRKAVLNIHFSDNAVYQYKMNTICVQDYTCDEIFQKKLLMFLPFFILRYNKLQDEVRTDENNLTDLLQEYETIYNNLSDYCSNADKAECFTNLIDLINRINNYFIKSTKIKGKVGSIMGGRVLVLKSEKLKAEGKAEARLQMIADFLNNGGTEKDAMLMLKATEKELKKAKELVLTTSQHVILGFSLKLREAFYFAVNDKAVNACLRE